jgi:hypothetical protein
VSASWLTRWMALVAVLCAAIFWVRASSSADAESRLMMIGMAVFWGLAALLVDAVALTLTGRRNGDGTRVCVAAALQICALSSTSLRYACAAMGASVLVLLCRGPRSWIVAVVLALAVGVVGWPQLQTAAIPAATLLVYAVAAHVEHHPHLDWTKR